MAKRVRAITEPAMLTWARESAGFDVQVAAKKIQVRPESLEDWERGQSRPTVKQLRNLARAYKRPLAAFYLPEPPKEFKPMHDFRRLPGQVAGVQSPDLRYEIRQAHNRRDLALDLYQAVEGTPPRFGLTARPSDEPEQVAAAIRRALGIRAEDRVRWRHEYDAFNHWRNALEEAGVLVFQATTVEAPEMRGFSILDQPLPAIVVNIKDPPAARSFSMAHELCHIMLSEAGLCDLDEEAPRPKEDQRVEVFCNMVAGASLVPRDVLLEEAAVRGKPGRQEWSDDEIHKLAGRYRVSPEVLLRRLLICGRTTEGFYQAKRGEWQEKYLRSAERREPGFVPPYDMAIYRAGRLFVRLVLASYYQDTITASDVSDYLEIRLKHLHRIEGAMGGEKLRGGTTS